MEKNVVSTIRQNMSCLNPALKKLAEYILANLEECKTITTKSLAATCDVAESTVTRFVREIGYGSFQELKITIAEYLTQNQMNQGEQDERLYEDLSVDDTAQDMIEKLAYRGSMVLAATRESLEIATLEAAVDIVDNASTVLFCCEGFSKLAAQEAVMRFLRTGKKCLLFEDQSSQLMLASVVGPEDALIGISNSGRTHKVVDSLKIARSRGCKTVAITSFEDSPIVQHADATLLTPTKSRGPESGTTWEAASSQTAQMLVVDALCACHSLRHYSDTVTSMNTTYTAIKDTRYPR